MSNVLLRVVSKKNLYRYVSRTFCAKVVFYVKKKYLDPNNLNAPEQ